MEKLIVGLTRLGYLIETDEKITFNMSGFENRLYYQKLIFLLNELSDELNYNYNWYIRGPYSPDLTKDLFYIDELWNHNRPFLYMINKKNSFNRTIDNAIDNLNFLKSSFNNMFNRDWEATDLEILSSLLFIDRHTYKKCRKSKINTIEEFKVRKPELLDKPIDSYWEILNKSEII